MYGIGRNRQAHAAAYAIDGRALIFPQQGIAAACDKVRRADLTDPAGLGQGVFDALDASTPIRKKKLSLGEQTRAFHDTMEAFRQEAKIGQTRFANALVHGLIHQTRDGITLTPMRAVRGRYGFERGGEDVFIPVPSSLDAATIGRGLALMLTR
ncbi:hypothetical protein [Pseudooctadecabacter sp.]|uniref:hypothetical protein n=1 Tax=Pseudooctadecabacter sp. TaxID=1966338 RepID=UPI0035C871AA